MGIFAAYFVVAMFVAAFNAKALGASVVFALAVTWVYPDAYVAGGLFIMYLAAAAAAAFRD